MADETTPPAARQERFQQEALRRTYVFLLALLVAGTLAGLVWKNWVWGLSFLAGAGASALNFRWFHQFAGSLGPGGRRRKRLALLLCARYLLFGVGGYVIVKYLGLNLTALLAGLLVTGAAVMAEILYELIYART